jgi:ribonuclease D
MAYIGKKDVLETIVWIGNNKKWTQAASEILEVNCIAVDMESNGLYSYPERICLIQLNTEHKTYLVDTLAVSDLSLLGEVFENPSIEKVMHGCDYDIRSFDRDYGFRLKNIFDTEVAAKFCGATQIGLDMVLKQVIGVGIDKVKRLQKANWGLRPLTNEMLSYAVSDVRYLIPLGQELKRSLSLCDRLEWVKEECRRLERIQHSGQQSPEQTFKKAKGVYKLNPRQLAIFKELFVLRQKEALRYGKPPFKVLSIDTLMYLAKNPDAELDSVAGVGKEIKNSQILKAIHDGLTAPLVVQKPSKKKAPVKWTKEARARYTALKAWREKKSEALKLAPNLIWPTRNLEFLSMEPFDTHGDLNVRNCPEVRKWQLKKFKNEIIEIIRA